MRSEWLAAGLGGALGSIARHAVNTLVARRLGDSVPHATLVVNLAGCAAIGVLAGLLASGRVSMALPVRVFVFVGILGGFTTFSSFGLDTFTLARSGRLAAAALNVVVQLAGGLAAVAGGYFAGLTLGRGPS
jgi:fluoride exporter